MNLPIRMRRNVWSSPGLAVLVAAMAFAVGRKTGRMPHVQVLRVPGGGIQPQVEVDRNGALHMIYFTGPATGGDIVYVYRAPGAKTFSPPIRVNSQPASAVAIGTVRGPQMAIGRDGRVDVVWFGSQAAQPRAAGGGAPVLFSRLDRSGTAFEPQRCVMQYSTGADGGLSVAADRHGNVYVVWHGRGSIPGEAHRRVYLARSADDGKTFAREIPISPDALGACGCCGMKAFVDHGGTLYVLYRAAAQGVHRDMTMLVSSDRGRTFHAMRIDPWRLNACPMTTAALSEGADRILAAWERAGEVYFAEINPHSLALSAAQAAPGEADDRKHPAIAANARGQILLAWTEGTGWEKGGSLAWQLFDRQGQPLGAEGRATGLPVWDLPSVFTNRHGDFMIVY